MGTGFGLGLYGLSPYGGVPTSLRVVSATAISPYSVVVQFDQIIDVTYPPFVDPANYTLPGLSVTSVTFASSSSVQLTTSEQSYVLYTVTVGLGRSASGKSLDVLYRSASFTGHAAYPGYMAVALSPRRVRLSFSTTMQANAALSNPASYAITGLDGTTRNVESVQLEQATNVLSLVLVLDSDLEDTEWYNILVSGLLQTTGGLSLVPNSQLFQWVASLPSLSVDLTRFTGEVQGGLYGNPLGLVFFSPALEAPAANSIIQIDSVDVCTTAYDTYTVPAPPDPFPLYTWMSGGPNTSLGQSGVSLWAPFPRLVEARFEITFTGPTMVEPIPSPIDGPATATLAALWAPGYVALLNNPYYTLGPPGVMVLAVPSNAAFICTNNLGPIPPGPVQTIGLQPPPTMLEAAILADSFLGDVAEMSALMAADSSLTAYLAVTLPGSSINGNSELTGQLGVAWDVSASMAGDSNTGGNLAALATAYWKFDASLADATGNGYDLQSVAIPPSYVAGKFNDAFWMPYEPYYQPSQYALQRPVYDPVFDLPGDFTVSLWFNSNDIITNGENSLIGTYNSNLALPTGWVIFVGGAPGYASFGIYGIQSYPSYYFVSANITAEFTLATWHHIVARRSGSTISLFLDGVLVTTGSGTGASPGGTPLTVGARGSLVRQAIGYFDDIGIWSVALTDDEVAWIWNGGAGRPLDALKQFDLTVTP